jgi:hypothetical protein
MSPIGVSHPDIKKMLHHKKIKVKGKVASILKHHAHSIRQR